MRLRLDRRRQYPRRRRTMGEAEDDWRSRPRGLGLIGVRTGHMPRAAIGGVRQSSQKAGDAVRQLLSPQHLQSVLKSLARSVQIAHAVAPDKWGLRLNFKSIMLKVG